jgi:hypothetical protein
MRRESKLRRVLLAITVALGILPLRPLILAFGVYGPAAQQCLLHGADCRCKAHCDRTARHQREAHEAPAQPACHHSSAGQEPSAGALGSEPGGNAPASDCAMTSCGKDTPMLLMAEGLPGLTAGAAIEIPRQFNAEPLKTIPLSDFHSAEASPPTPPPES